MSALLRRIAGVRGHLALLAALTAVGVGLVIGAPRFTNHLVDVGLRERVDGLPYQVRDLIYERTIQWVGQPIPQAPGTLLESHRQSFQEPLAGLVDDAWYSAQVGPVGLAADGPGLPVNGTARPAIGLREQTGAADAATLEAGAWPDNSGRDADDPIEAAVSREVADALRLRVGSRFWLGRTQPGLTRRNVTIVGVFTPHDARAPLWDTEPEVLRPYTPVGRDNDPHRGVVLVDAAGIEATQFLQWPVSHAWRYRLTVDRLDAGQLEALTAAVVAARRAGPANSLPTTGLDRALAEFADRLAAVRALLAVVQTGVLATLVGLVLLAAAAVVERRRGEFALVRARGAALPTIGARWLVEALFVVPIAAVAVWYAAVRLPGRPAGTAWLALLFVLVALTAAPVLSMAGHRRVSSALPRRDLATGRPSARRLTAEVTLVVAAAMGAWLLRRRGLGPGAEVDPFLASVPVLIAGAATVVALRLLPAPLRLFGRLAGRARGSVLFLGLTRAGRAAPASVGPVAVLVVAIATGVFSAVVTTTIDDARDRATDELVPADMRVSGSFFAPETADRIDALPGVAAVAPMTVDPARSVLSGTDREARMLAKALVVAVDMPALARVADASGVRATVPDALGAATPTDGPVPAVVSPTLAAEIDAGGAAELQGMLVPFRIESVAETFPGVPPGALRFVVLPGQALVRPGGGPLVPTGYLVAGATDPAAVAAIGDEGQRDWVRSVAARASGRDLVTTVVTWQQQRAELTRTGVNEVLRFTFLAGATGGTALALLAVAFAVLTGARTRGRLLSRLRTMGLSAGQGRRLIVLELAPLVGVGVLTGAAVGYALPHLLGPALGLPTITDGYAAGLRPDPAVLAAILGLVLLGLATAMVVEWAINRRLRLGDVLRLGEET